MILRLSILILSFMHYPVQGPSMEKIREYYDQAPRSEEATQSLIRLVEGHTESSAVLLAYQASATMMMANHVGNPFKKISYFREGKKLLEQAVEREPSNVEVRFLRFAAQSEIPGFLGYKDNLKEDKQLILQQIARLQDKHLQELIVTYMMRSDDLTQQEKEQLKVEP